MSEADQKRLFAEWAFRNEIPAKLEFVREKPSTKKRIWFCVLALGYLATLIIQDRNFSSTLLILNALLLAGMIGIASSMASKPNIVYDSKRREMSNKPS